MTKREGRFLLTHGCCFCDRMFTTFSYAARHQIDHHPRQCRINHMGYPMMIVPPLVYFGTTPGRKGVSKSKPVPSTIEHQCQGVATPFKGDLKDDEKA